MFRTFIRRLQGRPGRLAPPATGAYAPPLGAVDATAPVDYTLDAAELARRFHAWAFDVSADATFDRAASEAAFAHVQMVAHRFDARRMPRLPALVPQLLAAMRRDDTDAAGIAALVQRDPMIAAEVMRVANSAFYRRAQAPASMTQAVQAIGHAGLRHVVLGSALRPILRDAGPAGYVTAARLWSQAEARTWLCARLAGNGDGEDAGEAQLAGIVAGTGIAALARMLPPSLLADAAGDPDFTNRLLAIAHPLALRAGAHWQLPASVLDAIQAMHAPGDDAPPLARILRAADRLAMGYRLVEAGMLSGDEVWPTGLPRHDAPAERAGLFLAMAIEVEALEPAPVAA